MDYHEDLLFQDDLAEFNRARAEWLVFYSTAPHQALGLKAPIQTLFTALQNDKCYEPAQPLSPPRKKWYSCKSNPGVEHGGEIIYNPRTGL